jgi:hypothetical protein
MLVEDLMDGLSPTAQVLIAVAPFVIAMILRLSTGKSRTADWLITLTTVWFATNVLMAPHASGVRQGIRNLSRMLP